MKKAILSAAVSVCLSASSQTLEKMNWFNEPENWTFYINACNHTDNQSYSHIAAYE